MWPPTVHATESSTGAPLRTQPINGSRHGLAHDLQVLLEGEARIEAESSYGHLSVISTEITTFIECIIPLITTYNW